MSTLNARGHEVFDQTPIEAFVDVPARPSMAELVRQQVLRALAEKDMEDVSDFNEMDFKDDESLVGDGGPYVVPDEIPDKITEDMLTPSQETSEPAASQTPENIEKIDS